MKKKILFALILAALIFVRVYKIDDTARFTQDESTDLVRMAQYWHDKKITLVGPISTDNGKVFGSLTYYMQMPFAVLGKFDPISPVYAMAFWGVLTALLVWGITRLVNPKFEWLAILLGLIWYPLLESSRWAWNPYLVPFWVALGLWLFLKATKPYQYAIVGLCMGLAIHHHYIALLATVAFILWQLIVLLRKKQYASALLMAVGYGFALVPFALFDLRHPPGLFIHGYLLGGNMPHVAGNTVSVWQRLSTSLFIAGMTIVRQQVFAIIVLILTGLLAVVELYRRSKNVWWLLPVTAQISAGLFLTNYETRYFLPALLFYYVWLIQKRTCSQKTLQSLIVVVLLIGSLWTLPRLTKPEVQPSIKVLREVTNTIAAIHQKTPVKNANITAVASPDSDLIGLKYRDLLSLRHVPLRAASEYDASEQLFVISTSDEMTVRKDPSNPMTIFGKSKLRGMYPLSAPWKLYWFAYE